MSRRWIVEIYGLFCTAMGICVGEGWLVWSLFWVAVVILYCYLNKEIE